MVQPPSKRPRERPENCSLQPTWLPRSAQERGSLCVSLGLRLTLYRYNGGACCCGHQRHHHWHAPRGAHSAHDSCASAASGPKADGPASLSRLARSECQKTDRDSSTLCVRPAHLYCSHRSKKSHKSYGCVCMCRLWAICQTLCCDNLYPCCCGGCSTGGRPRVHGHQPCHGV